MQSLHACPCMNSLQPMVSYANASRNKKRKTQGEKRNGARLEGGDDAFGKVTGLQELRQKRKRAEIKTFVPQEAASSRSPHDTPCSYGCHGSGYTSSPRRGRPRSQVSTNPGSSGACTTNPTTPRANWSRSTSRYSLDADPTAMNSWVTWTCESVHQQTPNHS